MRTLLVFGLILLTSLAPLTPGAARTVCLELACDGAWENPLGEMHTGEVAPPVPFEVYVEVPSDLVVPVIVITCYTYEADALTNVCLGNPDNRNRPVTHPWVYLTPSTVCPVGAETCRSIPVTPGSGTTVVPYGQYGGYVELTAVCHLAPCRVTV